MISICIPLKNRSESLIRCLDSMVNIKGDFEVIVGDNYSDDIDWGSLTNKYSFNVIVSRWKGDWSIGKAKNIAANNSNGQILFFLDADLIMTQEVMDKVDSLVSCGWVYSPIMWLESEDRKTGEWGVHSFGQVALSKDQWESHKWVEWNSYGGDDNLFVEPYLRSGILIRDTPHGFIHQWHDNISRTKYYKNPDGHDLNQHKETHE